MAPASEAGSMTTTRIRRDRRGRPAQWRLLCTWCFPSRVGVAPATLNPGRSRFVPPNSTQPEEASAAPARSLGQERTNLGRRRIRFDPRAGISSTYQEFNGGWPHPATSPIPGRRSAQAAERGNHPTTCRRISSSTILLTTALSISACGDSRATSAATRAQCRKPAVSPWARARAAKSLG